ncbi:PREDICTED: coiled-coil domain-containing protein 186-like [Priapulus caudatus]|uniref:Coiled-coil domain-containing protein 186-like n=1 Tax=Priapulus caudatus TaxID=37621 RepID=A0ABM1EK02_PRICU|nr:PREDICTED: coiled-coil domain-containing protein 186-like [Priapulus caudatus]
MENESSTLEPDKSMETTRSDEPDDQQTNTPDPLMLDEDTYRQENTSSPLACENSGDRHRNEVEISYEARGGDVSLVESCTGNAEPSGVTETEGGEHIAKEMSVEEVEAVSTHVNSHGEKGQTADEFDGQQRCSQQAASNDSQISSQSSDVNVATSCTNAEEMIWPGMCSEELANVNCAENEGSASNHTDSVMASCKSSASPTIHNSAPCDVTEDCRVDDSHPGVRESDDQVNGNQSSEKDAISHLLDGQSSNCTEVVLVVQDSVSCKDEQNSSHESTGTLFPEGPSNMADATDTREGDKLNNGVQCAASKLTPTVPTANTELGCVVATPGLEELSVISDRVSAVEQTSESEVHSDPDRRQGGAKSVVEGSCEDDSGVIQICAPEQEVSEDAALSNNGVVQAEELYQLPNGLKVLPQLHELQQQCMEQAKLIAKLERKVSEQKNQCEVAAGEKTALAQQTGESEQIYLAQTKEMERTIAELQTTLEATRQQLQNQDAAARRALAANQVRIEQLQRRADGAEEERTSMVMRYACSEKELLDQQRAREMLERRLGDATRERDAAAARAHHLKQEKNSFAARFERKSAEFQALHREFEKAKEELNSQRIKVKWAQNKLQAEIDGHKETRLELEEVQRKLRVAREESEQIRRNCQQMMRAYHESEHEKPAGEGQHEQQQQHEHGGEKTNLSEVHEMLGKEIDSLRRQQKDSVEEYNTMKDKVLSMEIERQAQEKTLLGYQDILQNQKAEIMSLKAQIEQGQLVQNALDEEREHSARLQQELDTLRQHQEDVADRAVAMRSKERELLGFTEKVTAKNAQLQSQRSAVDAKVFAMASDVERLTKFSNGLQNECKKLEKELGEETRKRVEETSELTLQLQEKTTLVEQLHTRVKDEENENKVLKKRHTLALRDLQRELIHYRRRADESGSVADRDRMSGSLASSTGSLDTAGKHAGGVRASASTPSVARESPSLLESLRIIQSYVVREESGALTSEISDTIKCK